MMGGGLAGTHLSIIPYITMCVYRSESVLDILVPFLLLYIYVCSLPIGRSHIFAQKKKICCSEHGPRIFFFAYFPVQTHTFVNKNNSFPAMPVSH